MRLRRLSALVATCGTGLAAGAARGADAGQATTLSYDVDTALTYADAVDRSSAGTSAPRTLGLRRLRAELDWQAGSKTSLRLVLRPDAVNRQEETGTAVPVREIDTRAGDPGMQPLPTVRLVDAYQLTVSPSASLDIGAGVWESLVPERGAYPELLGFGLDVLLPAKFSGVRLAWRHQDQTGEARTASGLRVNLHVFQGNEDRAEAVTTKPKSFDEGTSARDPYYGSAAEIVWTASPRLELTLLGGYFDTSDPARHDESFAELSASSAFAMGPRDGKLSAVARYTKDKWKGDVADRQHFSARLTASLPVATRLWYLAGASYGKDDRWKALQPMDQTVPLTGYQLETGLLNEVGQDLYLQFMVTHEHRTTRDAAGRDTGGFQDAQGNRATIRRMGLELTYRLDARA